jgi:hypothetical protein
MIAASCLFTRLSLFLPPNHPLAYLDLSKNTRIGLLIKNSVSFDAMNSGFPNRTDLPPNTPWFHQDQHALSKGFKYLQGLANLLANGPEDRGLIV